ncbi:MAG: tetratricopeptide repeat protein, partial [bacterium]
MAGKNLELAKIYSALLQFTEDQNVLKEALSFYLSTGKYKEAIEVCYKLLSLNPDDLSVYQDLYLASKAISNAPSLILAIENILKLHTDLSLEAKVELMEELLPLYQEEQQYWDAINVINQLIKIGGKKIEYSYQLADLLSKVKKYEEALNIIYELISVDSSNALFYEKLAEIYYESGQLEQAIQAVQTAISIDPTNYKYYKILSNFYLEAGKIEELVVILKNLIEYNPDELEAYILLAQVYLSLKNYSEAYEYTLMAYSRANSREMEIPLKLFDIMLHAMAGVFKESQLINKFKEMVFEIKDPRYIPYLYFSISFFYWSKGFEVNSLEYLNNLLMISKNLDKTIFILANSMINYIKGKKKEAISYLEENQKIFKEANNQIKKKYYQLLINFYLLNNSYPDNLENYFKLLSEISDKYEVFHLVLKAMFMERLAKNKADYLNALFLYEKAINEGFKDPSIVFRAFFIHFV